MLYVNYFVYISTIVNQNTYYENLHRNTVKKKKQASINGDTN